jgi:nudix-type nucleoside diphosphatase (YffH/AdpP family)
MVDILKRETVYNGYSTIDMVTARLPDGSDIRREVESHGRVVAVLPYDPARKVVLLVRQFRAPVKVATGADDLLEPPAGMIDGQDSLEDSVRREAFEEVGLKLGVLDLVAIAFPSPGVSTETMALYLAEYRVQDRVGAGGGLDEEQENITVLETPLADLAGLGGGGLAVDMKLLVLVQALKLKRPDLFG